MVSFQGSEHFLLHFSGRESQDSGYRTQQIGSARGGQLFTPKSFMSSPRDLTRVSVESHVEEIICLIPIYIHSSVKQDY